MKENELYDVESLLDTARKLVSQAEQSLARDGFSDSWTDELVCIADDLTVYLTGYRKAWLEEAPF